MQSTEKKLYAAYGKKTLWPKQVFNSFINTSCIIKNLDNTNFHESLYNDFFFSMYMIMQVNSPTGMDMFQI